MSRRRFKCLDCAGDTSRMGEYYMLRDEVWDAAHSSRKGMLCVACIEVRLGRRLIPADFTGAYINRPRFARQSLRLRERLALT